MNHKKASPQRYHSETTGTSKIQTYKHKYRETVKCIEKENLLPSKKTRNKQTKKQKTTRNRLIAKYAAQTLGTRRK